MRTMWTQCWAMLGLACVAASIAPTLRASTRSRVAPATQSRGARVSRSGLLAFGAPVSRRGLLALGAAAASQPAEARTEGSSAKRDEFARLVRARAPLRDIDNAVDALVPLNPTQRPGAAYGPLAPGTWRVVAARVVMAHGSRRRTSSDDARVRRADSRPMNRRADSPPMNRRADSPPMNRGGAAAATWIFRGDELQRRRDSEPDRRGYSVETSRSGAATPSRIVRGSRTRSQKRLTSRGIAAPHIREPQVHAPHIKKLLGTVTGASFDVRYIIGDAGAISSHVRYDGSLVGTGWLSTRGSVRSGGEGAVVLDWTDGWIDPGAERWGEPERSSGAEWVRPLARVRRRADIPRTGRGDAAAATWIFRRADISRTGRCGCDVDISSRPAHASGWLHPPTRSLPRRVPRRGPVLLRLPSDGNSDRLRPRGRRAGRPDSVSEDVVTNCGIVTVGTPRDPQGRPGNLKRMGKVNSRPHVRRNASACGSLGM